MKLVDCIVDLLKYDPERRLTSEQCLTHPYLLETAHLNNPPGPPRSPVQVPVNGHSVYSKLLYPNGVSPASSLPSISPRIIPPSKVDFSSSQAPVLVQIPDASSSHRSSFYDSSASTRPPSETSVPTSPYGDVASVERHRNGERRSATCAPSAVSSISDRSPWSPGYPHSTPQDWESMDVNRPGSDQYAVSQSQRMDIQTSPMVREHPTRPPDVEPPHINSQTHVQEVAQSQSNRLGKFGALGFGKKHSRWGLGMFGHGDKSSNHLPPVQEVNVASAGSTPSLKRTQSSSTDSRSLSELSPLNDLPSPRPTVDPKQLKKDAERRARNMAREAEEQRRLLAQKAQREQARAVMEKNKRYLSQDAYSSQDVYSGQGEWRSSIPAALAHGSQLHEHKGKQPVAGGPIRQTQSHGTHGRTVNAAGGSFIHSSRSGEGSVRSDWSRRPEERFAKARRREFDDDHSMSSSDVQSGMSVISIATVDSDPGPNRVRHRGSTFDIGMGRMQSMSSLQTSSVKDDLSGRSSASLSLEQQFGNDLHLRASSSSVSDGGSPPPPPMHMLSLSSPIPWQHPSHEGSSDKTLDSPGLLERRQVDPSQAMSLSLPPQPRHPLGFKPSGPGSPYDPSVYGHPPSPGVAPKSAINPIFKVVSDSAMI